MKSIIDSLYDLLDEQEISVDKAVKRIISPKGIIRNSEDNLIRNPNPLGIKLNHKTVKNIIRGLQDKVIPIPGSLVYCDLMDIVEHSGIYIGDNTIVHLSGSGDIEAVSPEKFIARLKGLNKSMFIEVSCDEFGVVGSDEVAERAIGMVGKSRNYNLILDNCHQFAAGCLTGNFENANNLLWMLKDEARKVLGATKWRAWKR
jgi:hypothetical protein